MHDGKKDTRFENIKGLRVRKTAAAAEANCTYNAMTVDVEDYYMVSGFADVVKFADWHKFSSRVENSTVEILDLLSDSGTKATFFILGYVAEKHPGLVREIDRRGHEIACHGYNHKLVYTQTRDEFRHDVRKAKSVLESVIGRKVLGYRAPSYSITKESYWAVDILSEEGFRYDSSIFPIYHDRYGMPGAERFAYPIKTRRGSLIEFPPSTARLLGMNIPLGGGGYLRFFPLSVTRALTRRINFVEKQPVVFYVHPWEVDPDQPRLKGQWSSGFRHYVNIKSTLPKLKALTRMFKFKPLCEFYNEYEKL